VAKARTRSGGTGGQANVPPTPEANPPGRPATGAKPPANAPPAPNHPGRPAGAPGDGSPRPIRESAPDPVALAAAAVVLVAIALAAWLALFRVH